MTDREREERETGRQPAAAAEAEEEKGEEEEEEEVEKGCQWPRDRSGSRVFSKLPWALGGGRSTGCAESQREGGKTTHRHTQRHTQGGGQVTRSKSTHLGF